MAINYFIAHANYFSISANPENAEMFVLAPDKAFAVSPLKFAVGLTKSNLLFLSFQIKTSLLAPRLAYNKLYTRDGC